MDEWIDEWMDQWIDEWIYEWIDEWIDERIKYAQFRFYIGGNKIAEFYVDFICPSFIEISDICTWSTVTKIQFDDIVN